VQTVEQPEQVSQVGQVGQVASSRRAGRRCGVGVPADETWHRAVPNRRQLDGWAGRRSADALVEAALQQALQLTDYLSHPISG
jgi:hypothetical protein